MSIEQTIEQLERLLYVSPEGFSVYETTDEVVIYDEEGNQWLWNEGKPDHMFGTCEDAEWLFCYHWPTNGLRTRENVQWEVQVIPHPNNPNYRKVRGSRTMTITAKTLNKSWRQDTDIVTEPLWLAGALGRTHDGRSFVHSRFLNPEPLMQFDPTQKNVEVDKNPVREMSFCDQFISPVREKIVKTSLLEGRKRK